jgi:spore coat protein U-like protein
MNKIFRLVSAWALLAAGFPMAALAQTATTDVSVTVTVQGTCTLATAGNASQTVQPTTTMNLAASLQGSVTLTCNRGAAPVLSVGDGNSFSVTRRLSDGAVAPATPTFVGYAIKQPTIDGSNFTICPAHGAGTDWNSVTTLAASPAFTSSGGARTVNVCFQTSVNENTPVGVYSDTVVVTASY